MGSHKLEYCKSKRHKLEGDNIAYNSNGNRCCRICRNERARPVRKKWRERVKQNGGKFVLGKPVYPNQDTSNIISSDRMDEMALEWIERMDNDNRFKYSSDARYYSTKLSIFDGF